MILSFTVNGKVYELETDASRRLLDILREDMGHMGTKEGCGEGECGACTVLINGSAKLACLTVAAQLQGSEIITIEGLSSGNEPDTIQTAFVEELAIQCGYCTPGMIMTAKALLMENPNPTEEEIRLAIAGNICRCSGYTQIIRAVQRAAKESGKDLP